MKIAWIDCFAGISGDMTLGALVDCGLPIDHLSTEIKKMNLTGFSIKISKAVRSHITAKKVNITYDETKQPDRRYETIKSLIIESDLSEIVKIKSLMAFEILGKAESKIHGIPLEKVHFHEIGAVDSIIDLVGSIIGFEYFQIEKIYTNPIPLGTGFTQTDHGVMPVPSPAALEVLQGYPIVHRKSEFEMTTPTGATLVRVLSEGILPEKMILKSQISGYGAGSKETDLWPNVLRMVIGETKLSAPQEQLFVLETNIDDLNPEIYPYLMERLFKSKAKDVFLTPVIMKKGRPGTKVTVLAADSIVQDIENILFSETSTIGIRRYPVERNILDRTSKKIKTRFGLISVKISILNGREIVHPEYEHCLTIARDQGVRLVDVYREIEAVNRK